MNTLPSVRKPGSNKTMGIEIECVLPSEQVSRGFYKNFWYIGADGSIDTDTRREIGVEFVSQPLPISALKRQIAKLWKLYPQMKENSSCGIHVHASKKWVSLAKAARIQEFVENLSEDSFCDLFGREPNSYCQIIPGRRGSRYHAVNITPTPTVEFRMFSAKAHPKWGMYCLDMVEYLIQQSTALNLDAIYAFRDMKYTEYGF